MNNIFRNYDNPSSNFKVHPLLFCGNGTRKNKTRGEKRRRERKKSWVRVLSEVES
jgi:hypothetical protein